MNKAAKLKSDPCFIILGADSMLESLKAICEETEGVKEARDAEHIHRMRVATRRLRARLRVFGGVFSNKKLNAWTKEIRRLTRSLGEARDCDVQIILLENFKTTHPDEKTRRGISRLELRIRQRRTREQVKVNESMERLLANKVIEEMSEKLLELRILARMRTVPEVPDPASMDFARSSISSGLMDLLSHEMYLQDSDAARELHRMRIAAKRLRYTMETFESWFPDVLPKAIKMVKNVQELLGDIHDCDVWLTILPAFMEEEKQRAIEFYGKPLGVSKLKYGLTRLEKDRSAFRSQRLNELREFWSGMIDSAEWRQLIDTMFSKTESDRKLTIPIEESAAQPDQPAETTVSTNQETSAHESDCNSDEADSGRSAEA